MKKSLLWIVVLIFSISMIAAFSLYGCKPVAEEEVAAEEEAVEEEAVEEAEEEVPPAEVTLTVMIADTDYNDGFKAQIAAMEEELNIKSEVEVIPRAEGDTVILARLATGEMSDIFGYNTGALLQTLNPAENLLDISDQPFTENLTADFKTSASVGEKLCGIPIAPAMVGGWVYNKNIYEELGLEIPTTWAELMDNCEEIKTAGYTAVLGTFADTWTAQLILLADYYNVNALDPEFAANYTANEAHYADTPAALRGFEKLEEVYSKDLFNEDSATVTLDEGLRMFAEGEVAHYPMLSFVFGTISSTYPEAIEFTGMFPQPSDDSNINGITNWGSPGAWYVPSSCEDVENVMRWMEFMISQESIDAYATAMQISGPLSITGIELPANTLDVVSDIQKYFDEGKSSLALEYLSPIKGPNLPQICVEVGTGIKTALEGAQAYDLDVVAQAQQLGLEGW